MGSLLQPFLLLLIGESPGHGYELIDRLERLGMRGVEPGQVYRVLRGLERDGSVVSSWLTPQAGPARRRYELTPAGRARMNGWVGPLRDLHGALEVCLARWGETGLRRPDAPPPHPAQPGPARARAACASGRRGAAGVTSARSAAPGAAPGAP